MNSYCTCLVTALHSIMNTVKLTLLLLLRMVVDLLLLFKVLFHQVPSHKLQGFVQHHVDALLLLRGEVKDIARDSLHAHVGQDAVHLCLVHVVQSVGVGGLGQRQPVQLELPRLAPEDVLRHAAQEE